MYMMVNSHYCDKRQKKNHLQMLKDLFWLMVLDLLFHGDVLPWCHGDKMKVARALVGGMPFTSWQQEIGVG